MEEKNDLEVAHGNETWVNGLQKQHIISAICFMVQVEDDTEDTFSFGVCVHTRRQKFPGRDFIIINQFLCYLMAQHFIFLPKRTIILRSIICIRVAGTLPAESRNFDSDFRNRVPETCDAGCTLILMIKDVCCFIELKSGAETCMVTCLYVTVVSYEKEGKALV